ncbi:hypothetical protein [Naasia aerilata]|uniref:Uncharacterized protein n=1 Tax=Naasia aerilata TaxID=1162966 RepID=A0ABN6XJ73_9MICO|nr:hypothetical protein [Naasia aerilata]BDZ44148.1 hypothetical protein GCM10025866_00570 [Naasia aerilata]
MSGAARRVIPIEERAEWESALEGVPHAFAHTWASCAAMALTTGYPTFLYAWSEGNARTVCAIAERGDEGEIDILTPYGFGGFAGDAGFEDDWSAFVRERGYVCGYLGLNPLFAPDGLADRSDFAQHNVVHLLELSRGRTPSAPRSPATAAARSPVLGRTAPASSRTGPRSPSSSSAASARSSGPAARHPSTPSPPPPGGPCWPAMTCSSSASKAPMGHPPQRACSAPPRSAARPCSA